MNEKEENRFFLIIKKNKISFTSFNPARGSSLIKEIFIDDYSIEKIYSSLEIFLDKNFFTIEKKLKNFVEKIYLIFENDNFLLAQSSIKYNFDKTDINHSQIKDVLVNIRNEFKKYSPDHEIIHMVINKFIIDGVLHDYLPDTVDSKNLIIEVDFIFLNNQIIKNLKKIFSKYQISVHQILSYEYLESLNNLNYKDITKVANDNIDGLNINEVFVAKKILKNNGFFEKFFRFFN
ncbi:hypothetical protein IDG99_01785 [Pelagibacterales bacterium SAG-MED09]|nr:hypothetical protein [Pelagibacterales bacterium SAG-MED09]